MADQAMYHQGNQSVFVGGRLWNLLPPPARRKEKRKLKDRITPHVTNFFRLRLIIEKQEGKRKYKSDGAVMVGEFVCMYVCMFMYSE